MAGGLQMKITADDVNVTRNQVNGAIEVAGMVKGYRVARVYYDYTEEEALAEYLTEVNTESK